MNRINIVDTAFAFVMFSLGVVALIIGIMIIVAMAKGFLFAC